ncbi:MAG: 1,4-dihydroxy-2-naphthoate octaprenyltransferase [Bdellovibrionales bacterium]
MSKLITAIRPKTLTATFSPILATLGMCYFYLKKVDLWIFVAALASTSCIQIATNLFNDAIDFQKGADAHSRIGPKRVTQSGEMTVRQVYAVAIGFCIVSLLCGIPLVIEGGAPIVVIGLISIFMAYSYTGGPFPLAYLGLGDLFVMIFFGWIAVMGLSFIQTQEWQWTGFILGTQVGAMGTVLIAINNLRDAEEDKKVGKMTLAARFGESFTKREIAILYATAFGLSSFWFFEKAYAAVVLSSMTLIPVIGFLRDLQREKPGPKYNLFLGRAAKYQILFSLLLMIGFLIDGLLLEGTHALR